MTLASRIVAPCLSCFLGVSPALAAASCPWPEAMGQRLLDRRVGTLSLGLVEVEKAVAEICDRSDLPLSFIQAPSHPRISLELHDASVRQALDAVLAQAPEYRYSFVAERLILYPQEPVWQTRLENISLGPGPRLQVTRALAAELARRLPFFAHLSGAWVLGNGASYNYRDVVTVRGPGSLLELFVQLLGTRPGTFFIFDQPTEARASLSVSSQDQLRSLKLLAAATTTLHERGEAVQLRVIGTLRSGGDKNVTARACGTVYTVSDERVLSVSSDGLVSAHASGQAEVTADNESQEDRVTFTVTLPEPAPGALTGQQHEQSSAGPPQTPARGRGEGAGPVTKPLRPIEITIRGASASAAIQLLQRQSCVPVSFIAAARGGTVSLSVRGATVAEVLRQIAAQDPAYRAETIAGREVLYPAAPEFQVALAGIDIASTPRLAASYRYLERLRRDVPALSTLAAPMVIGDSRHPIFSEKVTLRPTGRVIEHLVDLLGQNPELYFEFNKAMSGVPELVFDMVNCAGAH